jgi:capsular polysaccharide export protein
LRRKGISVETWVFELGYLRPNYVTLELNQVNCHSNLVSPARFYAALPEADCIPQARRDIGSRWRKIWKAPTFVQHAFCNYKITDQAHKLQPKPEYVAAQVRGFCRKYWYGITEKKTKHTLANSPNFFLVILQVATDSQLHHGSPYVSVEAFIEDVITSFAAHAPKEARLFIKHHPRDRGYNNYSQAINNLALQQQGSDRIFYFHDSPLAPLFRKEGCRGCILINSSVGFQALYHGVPTKAMGIAPYNIEGLADQQPLATFWISPQPSDRSLFRKFYLHTLETTQINGNFDGAFPFAQVFPVVSTAKHSSASRTAISTAIQRTRRRGLHRLRRTAYRLGQLTLAYGLYAGHWLARLLRQPRWSAQLFEESARRCLKGLGVKVLMDRREPMTSLRAEVHIANHESPLDVLLVHGHFAIPAVTTAQLHLRWLVPGFRHAARRYGHLLMDHRCQRSRLISLRGSQKRLASVRRLFVFPSGSLKTSIQQRFSPSVAFLARQHDALVIPWRIDYQWPNTTSKPAHLYNPIALLISRLTGLPLTVVCSELPAVDPRDFHDDAEMTAALQKMYTHDSPALSYQGKGAGAVSAAS